MTDILFVAWNRLEFTRLSFETLLANTDWELVDRVYIHDDESKDGTTAYLADAYDRVPAPARAFFESSKLRSPVAVMNSYLDQRASEADAFVKIDNDIVVPPGWLRTLTGVAERNPEVELLGMSVGFGDSDDPVDIARGWKPSSHIGGVGLMRTYAFTTRDRPVANGRFGFTEWQHDHEPIRGWLCPPLPVFELDLVPIEPWASYSDRYHEFEWQRDWPPYQDPRIWSWAL